MVGAGRNRPVRVAPAKVAPGMPGRGPVAPVTVEPGMGPQEMAAVSRFAVRQAAPGMRFAQAVVASAPTGIALPVVTLPVIGCTEPAAARIGPSSVIAPDLSVVLRTLARRTAGPLSVVPLSAVPLTGDPSIAGLAAVPLAVLLVALGRDALGLAGPMGPGPTVAILLPPALRAAVIGRAPGP